MRRWFLVMATAVAALLVAGACSQVVTPAPTRIETQAPQATTTPPQQRTSPAPQPTISATQQPPGWQQKWDSTLALAKKEGAVSLYVLPVWGAGLRSSLMQAFKAKYGLDVEVSPLPAGELPAKVKAEQRAGLYLADVFGGGGTNYLIQYKPEGIVGPIEPMLILPEVLDPKAWAGGELFNYDKQDHMFISMLQVAARTIVYNEDLVKEGEISSYKDLLKPQFKGQVTILDPSDPTSGTVIPNHLVNAYGWDEAFAFLRELLVKQEAVIFKDARLQVEAVARGKYSVILGGSGQYKAEFIALGAPLAVKIPKEGDYVTTSFGGLCVPTKFAHPNAATIFVNWLLTKEGQSIFAKGAGGPSRRLDASTEGIDPIFVPLPGEQLRVQSPESDLRTPKLVDAVKVILNEAAK